MGDGNDFALFMHGNKIHERLIRDFERKAEVRLPISYKKLVAEQSGGTNSGLGVDFWNNETQRVEYIGFDELISMEEDSSGEALTMMDFSSTPDNLPEGIIPFGLDAGGNLFAFDFGKDKSMDTPEVVLLHWSDPSLQNGRLYRLASSFPEFLKLLIPENLSKHGSSNPAEITTAR